MNRQVVYRRVARTEYDQAAVRYESEQAGLGDALVAEIQGMLDEIVEHPTRYLLVARGIRQAILPLFPFGIFYRVQTDRIIVVAVLHHA